MGIFSERRCKAILLRGCINQQSTLSDNKCLQLAHICSFSEILPACQSSDRSLSASPFGPPGRSPAHRIHAHARTETIGSSHTAGPAFATRMLGTKLAGNLLASGGVGVRRRKAGKTKRKVQGFAHLPTPQMGRWLGRACGNDDCEVGQLQWPSQMPRSSM